MTITLLSDFGYQDNFVGVAKGILLQALPHAQIIDLSHEVMPFHMLQCSYFLKSAYEKFPPGTIHLSLFDIIHQKPSIFLVAPMRDQILLSADNGLLPLTFGAELKKVYANHTGATSYMEWMRQVATFILEWEQNGFSFSPLQEIQPRSGPLKLAPFESRNSLECQIIHVDRYGNVVINLSREDLERFGKDRKFQIHFSRNNSINQLSNDYADVPEGEKVCFFNSGGFLELAVNKGSAAQLFGLTLTSNQQLIYQKIKIEFQ
jgi:S-adenosylmethionine hydrolase